MHGRVREKHARIRAYPSSSASITSPRSTTLPASSILRSTLVEEAEKLQRELAARQEQAARGQPADRDAGGAQTVDGLVDLAHKIAEIGREVRGKTRRPYVTLSASSFIPKPETPFQWLGMDRTDNLYRKQDRIAGRVGVGQHLDGSAFLALWVVTHFHNPKSTVGSKRDVDGILHKWFGGNEFDLKTIGQLERLQCIAGR